MAETRVPASIDAIVAALQAAGLTIWDGPIVSGDFSSAVFIGYDGDPDGDYRAVTTTQTWSGLGQRKRDEEDLISCAAVALLGTSDTSWKPTRDAVYALLDTVGQTLRADPSLAQPPPYTAEILTGDYFQEATTSGNQGRLVFTIRISNTRV